jgi:hypothetical protein
MRYIAGAAVAALLLVGVYSLQSAGAQTTSPAGVVCAGTVDIPAGQVDPTFDINCPDVHPIAFVATSNPGWDKKDTWVVFVRGGPTSIRIHLNKPVTDGSYLRVAWIGFTFHR